MGKLWDEQVKFLRALRQLIHFAEINGIELTIGDAYRDPRLHGEVGVKKGYGHARSVHKVRLAVDLNAKDPADHDVLHDYWDKLGGAPRIAEDMNHYSFSWEGMR